VTKLPGGGIEVTRQGKKFCPNTMELHRTGFSKTYEVFTLEYLRPIIADDDVVLQVAEASQEWATRAWRSPAIRVEE
jgi:hypothetical protein